MLRFFRIAIFELLFTSSFTFLLKYLINFTKRTDPINAIPNRINVLKGVKEQCA